MNVQPPRDELIPLPAAAPTASGTTLGSAPGPAPGAAEAPPRSRLGRLVDLLLGKAATMVLAALALAVGHRHLRAAGRARPPTCGRISASALVLANLISLLLLGAVLAGRLTRVWVERRRGSAGSRLHVRLVLLFSGVAVAPTILVACFAIAFFHFGIQAWFNDPVREALHEIAAGRARLSRRAPQQHPRRRAGDGQRPDARRQLLPADPNAFADVLADADRVARPDRGGDLRPAHRPGDGLRRPVRRPRRRAAARLGRYRAGAHRRRRGARTPAIATRVRAVVQLDSQPPLMLMIGRPVDPQILDLHAAHRAGGRGIPPAGREPLLAADRLRLDLRAGGAAGAARRRC